MSSEEELKRQLRDLTERVHKLELYLRLDAESVEASRRSENELIESAKQVIKEYNIASTAFLQRRLQIGYGKAARIIETLEGQGLISKVKNQEARKIYF